MSETAEEMYATYRALFYQEGSPPPGMSRADAYLRFHDFKVSLIPELREDFVERLSQEHAAHRGSHMNGAAS